MATPASSKRGCPMIFEQKDIMIKFLTANPKLSSGNFDSNFTYKTAQNLWQQLTLQLNSTKGPTKNWKDWRKAWQDMKTRVKCKNLKIRQSAIKTGGRPALQDQLKPLEERITAELISKVSLVRLANMRKSVSCPEGPNDATTSFAAMEYSEAEHSETENSTEEEQSIGVGDSVSDINTNVTGSKKLFTLASGASGAVTTIMGNEEYYNKKLLVLERLAAAEERKATAEERIASAEERKAVAEERKAAVEERRVAIEERKIAVEERKTAIEERKAIALEHAEMNRTGC